MADRYKQSSNASPEIRFSRALFGEAERSRMTAHPTLITDFNAGDIVPIYCREVLPEEELSIDMDFVIRQTTLLTPTMGNMLVDIYAFWVPNRIVNQSWKAVMGENISGSWTASEVTLAPLKATSEGTTEIPIGSVADYYDIPTQEDMPNVYLNQMNDLKFRGYVMIYNEHFRDQNYQPPIPMSTLNVYQGFLDEPNTDVGFSGNTDTFLSPTTTVPDGDYGINAVAHALYGSSKMRSGPGASLPAALGIGRFRATQKPLKANKLHDYFTSVLPSPQKSNQAIFAPVTGEIQPLNVVGGEDRGASTSGLPIQFYSVAQGTKVTNKTLKTDANGQLAILASETNGAGDVSIKPTNLQTEEVTVKGLAIDLSDIRMAAAIQQVYEVFARGGSRYRSIVASFFGVDVEDPFVDIPMCLGHIRRDLQLYQTAQTSPSQDGSTPQGNLAGFGYTSNGGHLFSHRFVEHGYVHIFAIVRHKNIYSSYIPKDWFRMGKLDFYFPQMANISEQPVYIQEIYPFLSSAGQVFGYQEAWAEYRYEPDRVTGYQRPQKRDVGGVPKQSLSVWNYADDYGGLPTADGNWIKSNSEEVLNRTLAVTSGEAPQFKAMFMYHVDKTLPMPTYSVPGMDII